MSVLHYKYFHMLGKPFVFYKAISCVPHLRSHSVTVLLHFRVQGHPRGMRTREGTLCTLLVPYNLKGEELEQKGWHYPFGSVTMKLTKQERPVVDVQTDGTLRQKQPGVCQNVVFTSGLQDDG